MPLLRIAHLTVLSLGLAAVLHASSAAAQTPPCGTVLTQSIQLTSNMVCNNTAPALVVGADNVQISLNGFEISGHVQPVFNPNFFLTYAPAILSKGFSGVRVIGPGRIAWFLYDVWIIGGRRHVVADISGGSAAGVFLSGTSYSRVENSDLEYGARVHDDEGPPWFTPAGTAMRNEIVGNRIGTALYRGGVASVYGCRAQRNSVRDNTMLGQIFIGGGAARNTIHGNRLHIWSGTAAAAINVGEAFENDITENMIEADGEMGISIEPWQSPQCSKAGQTGKNGDDNFVYANVIRNGSVGVRVGAVPPAPWTLGTGNVILGNTFMDMTVAGQRFGANTANNDGRRNKYSNVAVEVEDLGSGNLWP